MGKAKAAPSTVSHKPLFDWFAASKGNRAKLRAAGYTDGRITNWKVRGGIPRGELASVAAIMGLTFEQYAAQAGEPLAAKEPSAIYGRLSDEALAIARAFDQLQPQAQEFVREQIFIYTVIDKSFPWLRRGRPVGTTYDEFEKWHQENIDLAIKGGAADTAPSGKPRPKEKAK